MYYLIVLFIFIIFIILTLSGKEKKRLYKMKKTINYDGVYKMPEVEDDFIQPSDEELENMTIPEESENFQVKTFKIKSRNVDEIMEYIAIIPKKYNQQKSYPCVFLLHGLRDQASDWILKARILDHYETLLREKRIGEMIIILPNSGFDGESWYTDFKKMENKKYESYFIDELVEEVKMKFNITKFGISGFSMGGYGAFKLGLKHLNIFEVIGSFAGAVSLIRLTINRRIARIVKFIYLPNFLFKNGDKEKFITIFGSWGRKIIKEDPYTLIKKINLEKQQGKKFYLSVGSEDKEPYFMVNQWMDMVGRLKRFNLSFEGYIYMGETHRWGYVSKDLRNFLKYSWKNLK